MSNASMTFGRPTRAANLQPLQWLSTLGDALAKPLASINAWLQGPAMERPRTAQELIEYARSIEASQPSFAADLRAAALRSQENTDS